LNKDQKREREREREEEEEKRKEDEKQIHVPIFTAFSEEKKSPLPHTYLPPLSFSLLTPTQNRSAAAALLFVPTPLPPPPPSAAPPSIFTSPSPAAVDVGAEEALKAYLGCFALRSSGDKSVIG
jgi:hypothetical protein